MKRIELITRIVSSIYQVRNHKEELIKKLKDHVNRNITYYKNVSRETLTMIANFDSNDYLCFDTESCRDITKSSEDRERVWCWSLSNTQTDEVIYGYSLTEFIILMKRLHDYKEFNFNKKSKTKNISLKIWVHNLGWDYEFLKYWLDEFEFQYYSKILYADETVEEESLDCDSWTIVENDGQVYNATINLKMNDIVFGKKRFKSFTKLRFYDSVKLIPNKLDEIGKKIIKIDEMFYKIGEEFDYDYIRGYDYKLTEIEKCYIYNDVYILKEFIRQYYIANGLKGFTASGIAFNNMLEYMFPDSPKKYEEFEKKYPPLKDRKIIELVNDSYNGGYTNTNPSHKGKEVNKKGHSIDRNSSYPSEMKYGKLPYGKPKYFKGKYIFDSVYDIAIQKIHFDGFKRKNNSPIGFIKIGSSCDYLQDIKKYGYKNNDYVASNFDEKGNLLTFNYNLVLTTSELKLLETAYDFYTYRRVGDKILKGNKNLIKGYECIEGCKFKSQIGDLGEFIDDCVSRKIKYKEEKNSCGVNVAKVDMNSIYGKLGSNSERVIYNYIKDENGFFKHQRKYISNFDYDYEEKRKYYKPYSAFTTSYGRIALISIILKIEDKYGSDEYLYSDTDSIYATLTVEQFRELGVELHKTKLGAWDIEKEFIKFKCLGAKKYILLGREYESKEEMIIIQHCAGLPNDVQKSLNFENFYLGQVFKKKQKKKVIGGYRLEPTTFELKEFSFYR